MQRKEKQWEQDPTKAPPIVSGKRREISDHRSAQQKASRIKRAREKNLEKITSKPEENRTEEEQKLYMEYQTEDTQPPICTSVTAIVRTRGCGRKSALLPVETVEYLMSWMMSPEHIAHPYPTKQEKAHILAETGIELKQLMKWFMDNRQRYWKPYLERNRFFVDIHQLSSGYLQSVRGKSSNKGK